MSIRFVGYQETPDQHQAGIATIEFTTKVDLPNNRGERTFVFNINYKIVAKNDNTGFFPAIAGYRTKAEGPGNYRDCFELDSNSLNKEIETLVMEGFKAHYAKPVQNAHSLNTTSPNQLYGTRQVQAQDRPSGAVSESQEMLPF